MADINLIYRPEENRALARVRWDPLWLLPKLYAKASDNPGKTITMFDSDGVALAGFVPDKRDA